MPDILGELTIDIERSAFTLNACSRRPLLMSTVVPPFTAVVVILQVPLLEVEDAAFTRKNSIVPAIPPKEPDNLSRSHCRLGGLTSKTEQCNVTIMRVKLSGFILANGGRILPY